MRAVAYARGRPHCGASHFQAANELQRTVQEQEQSIAALRSAVWARVHVSVRRRAAVPCVRAYTYCPRAHRTYCPHTALTVPIPHVLASSVPHVISSRVPHVLASGVPHVRRTVLAQVETRARDEERSPHQVHALAPPPVASGGHVLGAEATYKYICFLQRLAKKVILGKRDLKKGLKVSLYRMDGQSGCFSAHAFSCSFFHS